MVGLLALGYPMFVPLLATTMALLYIYFPGISPEVAAQQMIGGVKPAALIAVPMFIFAAEIMTSGQTANRLLNLVETFVGHMRGGLAVTSALACTLFGAISGSTQATVVAIGKPLRPRMLQAGYPDSFVTALIINVSDIALLLPPSIGMIVYGVVSGTSIGELFIAGIGPGVLILVMFSAYSVYAAGKFNLKPVEPSPWSERRAAIKDAVFPLGFPVIIIGGIYTGAFSPTEAAAVSVLYALLLEMFVFKKMKLSDLPRLALSTGLVTAVVFTLVGAGTAFSWVISFAELPAYLINETLGLSADSGYWRVALTLCVAYFVGCMFVDPIVVILILTPIFHPVALAAGLDPVLTGVLVTLQVAIGSATPPFGCDIFTAIAIFRKPYREVISGTPPFIAMLFFVCFLVIAFPQIALFLRDLAFQ